MIIVLKDNYKEKEFYTKKKGDSPMESSKSIDPYSRESFLKRRSDQRFASKKTKNAFHNGRAKEQRDSIAFIQKPLMKNRNILNHLLGKKNEHEVSKDFLLGAGYDFRFFTGTVRNRNAILIYEFEITNHNSKIVIKKSKTNG
jgi:hypothetical protein